jgi:hypothetical protein
MGAPQLCCCTGGVSAKEGPATDPCGVHIVRFPAMGSMQLHQVCLRVCLFVSVDVL